MTVKRRVVNVGSQQDRCAICGVSRGRGGGRRELEDASFNSGRQAVGPAGRSKRAPWMALGAGASKKRSLT